MIAPLFVGRPKSINALEAVMENNKEIVLLTQKKPSTEDPKSKDLYETGTIGNILQLLKLPDGTVKVLIEGKRRCLINKFTELELFLEAEVNVIEENVNEEKNKLEQIDELINVFEQYVKINGKINSDVISTISEIVNAGELSDNVINHLLLGIEEKQSFLEMLYPHERIEKLIVKINSELGILESEKKVRGRVKRQMEKTQREYYLNEQLKAIQKELGSSEEGKNELMK
jgi:ATP-dependent Lon protease